MPEQSAYQIEIDVRQNRKELLNLQAQMEDFEIQELGARRSLENIAAAKAKNAARQQELTALLNAAPAVG